MILLQEKRNLKNENEELKKVIRKYRKRNQRLRYQLQQSNVIETPRKRVKKLMENKAINAEEINKRMLFGEVLSDQIKENFKTQKSVKNRLTMLRVLTGKIIQKYKYINYVRDLTSQRMLKRVKGYHSSTKVIDKKREHKAKRDVQKFLQTDRASRMCSGKKETITRNKIKKQKRFLNYHLSYLHQILIQENPYYDTLSYRSFCRLRPFWVLFPKASDRETCLCKTHENMNLIVSRLHSLRLIHEKSSNDVVKRLCCDVSNHDCLERKCEFCQGRTVAALVKDFQDDNTIYQKWVTEKVPIMIKGKEKLCQKTLKCNCEISTKGLLSKDIFPFVQHLSNIYHQYENIKKVKESFGPYDFLWHIDFSENFVFKYAEEIQSAHFRGSKHQLSLHTVVLYFSGEEPKCFAIVSESTRYDPPAVVAHLAHVIENIKSHISNVK